MPTIETAGEKGINSGKYDINCMPIINKYLRLVILDQIQITPVMDNSCLETRNKLTTDRKVCIKQYVYHVHSSCLVTGKQAHLFIESDFQKLFKTIGAHLSSEKTTSVV